MGVIKIEDMRFYAQHGCFEEEQRIGTWFRVDLAMETDTGLAEQSDDIADTVNYLDVYAVVKQQMLLPSKLLEHVAARIAAEVCSQFAAVRHVQVKVSKLNPPLGGDIGCVSVEVERQR